jgi:hypothetical protein
MAFTFHEKHLAGVLTDGTPVYFGHGECLSTDEKPTVGVANGSDVTEIDTGDVYLFNETGAAWVKQFSLQGG